MNKKRPQDKWDKKAGLKAKTYKVNEEVAEQFKLTCARLNVAMGTELTKMMSEFNEKYSDKQE